MKKDKNIIAIILLGLFIIIGLYLMGILEIDFYTILFGISIFIPPIILSLRKNTNPVSDKKDRKRSMELRVLIASIFFPFPIILFILIGLFTKENLMILTYVGFSVSLILSYSIFKILK